MTRQEESSAGVNRRQALRWLGLGGGFLATLRGKIGLGETPLAAQSPSRVTFPRGAIIRTVLKDISPDSIGTGHSLIHEHLNARDLGEKKLLDPEGRSDEAIIQELRWAAQEGLR